MKSKESEKNQLLIYNCLVETFNEEEHYNWVLMKDGVISELGVDEPEFEKDVQTVDLLGAYVVPGFIDNHVHLVQSGMNINSTSLKNIENIGDILGLAEKSPVIETDFGPLVYLKGFEENNLSGKVLPTRWDLDTICPNEMIWINSVEYHTSILNTKAYKFLNLMFNIDGIDRDEESIPTGILTGQAGLMARKRFLDIIPNTYREKGVKAVFEKAISEGITTMAAMEGGFLFNDKDAEFINENKHTFPIDVELFFQTTDIEKVKKMGLNRIGGNIMLDGSIQSRSAALRFPYEDDYKTRGNLFFSDKEIKEFVFSAIREDLDISLHAVGSRAISQALYAYFQVKKTFPKCENILRIEHFELPNNEEIEMASTLGVVLSMQPSCDFFWGGTGSTYEKRLGIKRTLRANPMASIIKSGVLASCGSESDITPLGPILGIHAMVNHSNKEERIDPVDAIKLFTLNGAKSLGDKEKGVIKVGKIADLAVLSNNLNQMNILEIKDVRVLYTIKDGKIIYRGAPC